MTMYTYLLSSGFKAKGEQPVGATDYVLVAGVFRLRVRIPLDGYETRPALWVGFTAGGPVVEKPSHVQYKSAGKLVEDAIVLRRILHGV